MEMFAVEFSLPGSSSAGDASYFDPVNHSDTQLDGVCCGILSGPRVSLRQSEFGEDL